MLSTWLKPTDVGVEWGAGRSTVWFARRVSRLVSVEHDDKWRQRVSHMLVDASVRGIVDLRLLDDWDRGEDSDYVRAIAAMPPQSLDFALVDGVARDWCALACLEKVRSGGIVIIDNANWYLPCAVSSPSPGSRGPEDGAATPQWEEFSSRVGSWRTIWTSNGVTDTAIWVKP